jgi:hypothetical protein
MIDPADADHDEQLGPPSPAPAGEVTADPAPGPENKQLHEDIHYLLRTFARVLKEQKPRLVNIEQWKSFREIVVRINKNVTHLEKKPLATEFEDDGAPRFPLDPPPRKEVEPESPPRVTFITRVFGVFRRGRPEEGARDVSASPIATWLLLTLILLLLLVVLWRSGGSARPGTQSWTMSMAEIEEAGNKVMEASKAINQSVALSKDLERTLNEQKQSRDALRTYLDGKFLNLTQVDAVKLAQEVGEHLKGPRVMPKGVDEMMTKMSGNITVMDQTLGDFKKAIKDLQTEMAKVNTQGGKSAAAPFGDGQDVLIVALHSPALNVNSYLSAYQEVFRTLPRDKEGPLRVGFVTAQTAEATPIIKLDDDRASLDTVGPANVNAVESPGRFGVTLKEMFTAKRPRQRVILVASGSCPPLRPDEPGWVDIPQVDVVLIQREALSDKGKDALLHWHEFCLARRGFVQTLGRGDSTEQTRQLKDILLQLCQTRK